MRWNRRWLILMTGSLCLGIVLVSTLFMPKEKILRLGIYAGSSWDVPNSYENRVLDELIEKFESQHPAIRIQYESGIPKENYEDWLAERMLLGEQPDVFIVPENSFSQLAKAGAFHQLDGFSRDNSSKKYYPVAYESGLYRGKSYALPIESNPIMMCVNKDLLEKEGIAIPSTGWTLDDLWTICQKVTKDTNGDGIIDQYGITDYDWKQALVAYGGRLQTDRGLEVDTPEMEKALAFISKLEGLHQNYKVRSTDFDEGKVAFYPMSLAQYRTYKPYPYHVAKYSKFLWTCIPMPGASLDIDATQVRTSLLAMSSKTKHRELAWEFIELLCQNVESQQELFEKSQGTSSIVSVVTSDRSVELLEASAFGSDSISSQKIDYMMRHSVLDISQDLDIRKMERMEYLIAEILQTGELGSRLPSVQRGLDLEYRD